MLFKWDESYSVHIASIDAQHQKLIGFINDLHAAMLDKRDDQALTTILDDLITYTRVHFADEEKLMAQYEYSGLKLHRRQHEELTGQVVDLQRRLSSGELALSLDVMKFLRKWLSDHILSMDKAYSSVLCSRGAK